MALGKTICLWRLKAGLTQAELARRAGISRPNLSVIERDGRDVTVGTLKRIAVALGVVPGVLVDGIAPERQGRENLSRVSLDRIARRVMGFSIPLSSEESEIANCLGNLMKQKLGRTKQSKRNLPRTARVERQSWRRLRAMLETQELENLFSRITKIKGTSK